MNIDIFILNGYGQFIWSAFILTFLSCFLLFLKTKKKLIKQERALLQYYKQSNVLKGKTAPKENTKKILSGSPVF